MMLNPTADHILVAGEDTGQEIVEAVTVDTEGDMAGTGVMEQAEIIEEMEDTAGTPGTQGMVGMVDMVRPSSRQAMSGIMVLALLVVRAEGPITREAEVEEGDIDWNIISQCHSCRTLPIRRLCVLCNASVTRIAVRRKSVSSIVRYSILRHIQR